MNAIVRISSGWNRCLREVEGMLLHLTRKAARARDRSHFGVPAGFDRFRPGLRHKALKYIHIPTPFLLGLNEIASNLERGIKGSWP